MDMDIPVMVIPVKSTITDDVIVDSDDVDAVDVVEEVKEDVWVEEYRVVEISDEEEGVSLSSRDALVRSRNAHVIT